MKTEHGAEVSARARAYVSSNLVRTYRIQSTQSHRFVVTLETTIPRPPFISFMSQHTTSLVERMLLPPSHHLAGPILK